MWVSIDTQEFESRGADYIRERIAHYAEINNADAQKYRDAVPVVDGDLEVDDDSVVSFSDDGGAYVMCWKWVDDADAGIRLRCGDCNAELDEAQGDYMASPCGSFCRECMEKHAREGCGVCAAEFGIKTDDEEEG